MEEIKKDEILDKYPLDGEEYFKNLFFYLDNYEEIINSKKPRYRKIWILVKSSFYIW